MVYLGEYWDILPITANCEAALRAIRYVDEVRTIWIDSICIDQDDAQERSHQVSLMRHIYAEAWRVLVYLGEATDDSDLAMKLIGQIDDKYRPSKQIEKSSIANLFQRNYFNRTWIIQEVALADSLVFYCGQSSAFFPPYAALRKTVEYATESQVAPPWMRHCQTTERLGATDLVHLVIQSQRCQCADPRDRVFALLGLLNSTDSEGFVPDYSLSVENVFIGLAAHALQRRSLDSSRIFQLAVGTEPLTPCLPSWTPNWASSSTKRYDIMAELKVFTDASQGDSSKAELRFDENMPWEGSVHSLTGSLSIRGLLIRDFQGDSMNINDTALPVNSVLLECRFINGQCQVTLESSGEERTSIDKIKLGAGFCIFLLEGCSSPVLLQKTDHPNEFLLLSTGSVFIYSPMLDLSRRRRRSNDSFLFDEPSELEEKLIPIPILFNSPLYCQDDHPHLCDYPLVLHTLTKTEEVFLNTWMERLAEIDPPTDANMQPPDYWRIAGSWYLIRALLADSWHDSYHKEKRIWQQCSISKIYLKSVSKNKATLQALLEEVIRRNGEPGWLWQHKYDFADLEKVEIWNIDKILCFLITENNDLAESDTIGKRNDIQIHTNKTITDEEAGADESVTAANAEPSNALRDSNVLDRVLKAGQVVLDLIQHINPVSNDSDELIDSIDELAAANPYWLASSAWRHHFNKASQHYRRPEGLFDFRGWLSIYILQELITPSQSQLETAPIEMTSDQDMDGTEGGSPRSKLWSWEEMERQMNARMTAWAQVESLARDLKEATASIDLQLLMHKVISQAVFEPFGVDLTAKRMLPFPSLDNEFSNGINFCSVGFIDFQAIDNTTRLTVTLRSRAY